MIYLLFVFLIHLFLFQGDWSSLQSLVWAEYGGSGCLWICWGEFSLINPGAALLFAAISYSFKAGIADKISNGKNILWKLDMFQFFSY